MECSSNRIQIQQTNSIFVESKQSISTIDYSINLMWVNRSHNPNQQYLYPAQSEADLETKLIKPIMEWAKATGKLGQVNLWYDSLLTPQQAMLKTKQIFASEVGLHSEIARIHFKDVRELPEVSQHPEVFSDKTPVYFRADLLRVLAGYHKLTSNASHCFVYSDLDVKPLSKEELFDAKTQKKLYQFGIVMTRGGLGLGCGLQPYENMFHMMEGHKPNLLKAMKVAIIDISIERAEYILNGGHWAYHKPRNTQPLEQTVYDSYKNMFYYYYQLEGWSKEKNISCEFGLQEINTNYNFPKKITKEITVEKENFSLYDGKIGKIKAIKLPTKIIVAPPSHFGTSPITKHDPHKISPKNFKEKLQLSLEGNTLDNALLYLVARNNYLQEAQLIVDKLTPEALTEAMISPNTKFGCLRPSGGLPLLAAIEEGHLDFIRLVVERIFPQPELCAKIADVIAQPHDEFNQSILHAIAEKENNLEVFKFLVTSFANYPKMAEIAIWALFEMKKTDAQLFCSLLDSAPDAIFENREQGNTLALKAAKNGHHQLLKIIAEKAPHTLAQKGSDGNFPLLYVTNTDFATFTALWQVSPDMLTEKGARSRTVAHAAATYGQLQIIQLIAEKAPALLSHQDEDKCTPVDEAAHDKRNEVFKFLVDQHPDTLKIKNRFGWSAAATAANSNNIEGMKYLIEKMPDLILSDFSNIWERAKCWSPEIMQLLTENFPERSKRK